jgi:hypothetical protein
MCLSAGQGEPQSGHLQPVKDSPNSSYSHIIVHSWPSSTRPMSVSTAQPRPCSSSSTSTLSGTCVAAFATALVFLDAEN